MQILYLGSLCQFKSFLVRNILPMNWDKLKLITKIEDTEGYHNPLVLATHADYDKLFPEMLPGLVRSRATIIIIADVNSY